MRRDAAISSDEAAKTITNKLPGLAKFLEH
jgi:hypothetical protein